MQCTGPYEPSSRGTTSSTSRRGRGYTYCFRLKSWSGCSNRRWERWCDDGKKRPMSDWKAALVCATTLHRPESLPEGAPLAEAMKRHETFVQLNDDDERRTCPQRWNSNTGSAAHSAAGGEGEVRRTDSRRQSLRRVCIRDKGSQYFTTDCFHCIKIWRYSFQCFLKIVACSPVQAEHFCPTVQYGMGHFPILL